MVSAIVVFSHLRWDFVFQRPQHILQRLAQHYQIIFIEEPIHHETDTFLKMNSPQPNILVCQPHTPVNMPGFHDDQLPYLHELLKQVMRGYDEHIAWFYTPMALPLLQELDPHLVVYDCMDELAAFMGAPKQLVQRESALLKIADIVFTGGHSLYQSKRERHPNVHCFPSSVDAGHFVQALDRANSHPLHREIPGPRLGYYGVIDERFDTELVAKLADAHAQWQIVLVGPVVKIDPASLPQRPNIHYLGQQPYQALPQFLAGWDVCLLPFALNESTRFISPTKTLEYMAAELPIVSTPVTDVANAYSDIVAIAQDAASFIAACEAALLASPEEHARKVEKMRRVLALTSWDATVEKMHTLLRSTPRRKIDRTLLAEEPADSVTNVDRLHPGEATRFVNTAIIGAGPTGLSAAYHLGHDSVLLEKSTMVGGGCRSVTDKGFTFDHVGHVMLSSDPYVLEMVELLLGSNIHWQENESWIYSKNVYTRYPFHRSLHGLPRDVVRECIAGAIEACCGGDAAADGRTDCRADGGMVSPNVAALDRRGSENFEEFIYRTWGSGIARHFMIPYNRKLWGMPLAELETSWLNDHASPPDLEAIIDGALGPEPAPAGIDTGFAYPMRGGFQALMSGFVPHIKGTVELNAEVVRVSPRQRTIVLSDGRRYQYENLISTMPLPELVKAIGDEAPEEVRQAAKELKHVSVRCVNLGIGREAITDKHWIYYPEDTIFHRIFAQGNASPDCNPPGGFGLTCEITYSPEWKPLHLSGKELIERCVQDCIRVGLLREDDVIITANETDKPYAYVVYDHARARNARIVKDWIAAQGIILAGRYSEWEHHHAEHAFIAGKKAAEAAKWAEPKRSMLAE